MTMQSNCVQSCFLLVVISGWRMGASRQRPEVAQLTFSVFFAISLYLTVHINILLDVAVNWGDAHQKTKMQTCWLSKSEASPNSPMFLEFVQNYSNYSAWSRLCARLFREHQTSQFRLSVIYKGPQSSKRMQSRHLRSRSLKLMTSPRR